MEVRPVLSVRSRLLFLSHFVPFNLFSEFDGDDGRGMESGKSNGGPEEGKERKREQGGEQKRAGGVRIRWGAESSNSPELVS